MFKAFFWKERRETYPAVVLAVFSVIILNLYILKFRELHDIQRNMMCFFIWPGFMLYFVHLLFSQEIHKETLGFLFSKPIPKHVLWFTKVICGLIFIILMCLFSLPVYAICAGFLNKTPPLSAISDPTLLIGFCVTISIFSVLVFCSTISLRRIWLYVVFICILYFVFSSLSVIWENNPSFNLVKETLLKKPFLLSSLILGVSPIFFFGSFVFFNQKELLNIHKRRTITYYILTIGVIIFILYSIADYVKVIGYLPAPKDIIETAAVSPDQKTILMLIVKKDKYQGGIYTIGSDGTNLKKLIEGAGDRPKMLWSLQGDKIAFGKNDSWFKHSLCVMDKNGGNVVKIKTFSFFAGLLLSSIVWSPDGNRLAYDDAFMKEGKESTLMNFTSWRQRLTISRVDGTENIHITFPVLENAYIYPSVWARNGTLYFQKCTGRRRKHYTNIWFIKPGETKPNCLGAEFPLQERYSISDVSSKGWIAYIISEERKDTGEKEENTIWSRRFIVENDKGEKILETKDGRRSKWNPDGRYLSYTVPRENKKGEITGMDCRLFDTQSRQEIIFPLGKNLTNVDMQWSPDSKQILFIFSDASDAQRNEFRFGVCDLKNPGKNLSEIALIKKSEQYEIPFVDWIGVDELVYRDNNSLWTIKTDGSGKKKIFSVKSGS